MPKEFNKSSLIASDVVTEPSPIELLDVLGSDSKDLVPKTTLQSYVFNNQLPKEANEVLFNRAIDFDTAYNKLKDFFNSVKCGPESKVQEVWVPTWEIHRPKIEKCTATLKKTSTTETDFSMNIKIFGIGGGTSMSRKIGYTDTIEASGKCLQVRLPVSITNQTCETKKGEQFPRINVKNIGDDPSLIELTDPRVTKCGPTESDKCRPLALPKLEKSGWKTCTFDVPDNSTWTRDLDIQSSQAATIDIEPTIGSLTIGPKAVLTLAREIEYTYKLVGPHKYTAFFPKNSISYYWSN